MNNNELIKVLSVLEQDHRTKGCCDILRQVSPELAEWNRGVADGILKTIKLLQETADISDFL